MSDIPKRDGGGAADKPRFERRVIAAYYPPSVTLEEIEAVLKGIGAEHVAEYRNEAQS